MSKRELLLEIGCEEIPARFVDGAANQLGEKLADWLKEKRVSFDAYRVFSTPRRLAVLFEGVDEKQEDVHEEVKGPAARIAKTPEGAWSKAAEGFAKKQGITVDQLELKEMKGETYVFARVHHPGKATSELLLKGVPEVISSLHFPKTMRWGAGRTRFIRPVRWLVCLYGEEVVPVSWAGLTAGRKTRGHRFLGQEVEIHNPGDYLEQLRQQFVIADPEERQAMIRKQLRQLEEENGWIIPVNPDLLHEVTHLVEYPTALSGSFDTEFLALPREVLITTMREHQRYFPVESRDGALLPHFVTVRNGDEKGLAVVAKGNEKVLRARLADARFFFEEDQKLLIETAIRKLDQIVYQEELGSLGNRVRRVGQLALSLADDLVLSDLERQNLMRAGEIAKFDLATQMVGEFPELEGVMGRIYALWHGETAEVAEAVYEHHLPRFAGDDLPQNRLGALLSIADKLDAVVSSFAIGIQPTGSQDPYGLRRKAAGVVQILLQEGYHSVSLKKGLRLAMELLAEANLIKVPQDELETDLISFFALRLKAVMQEEGIRYDVIDAVLEADIASPSMALKKARVLMEQMGREEFKFEVEGFTRVANLARKAGVVELDGAGLTEDAEKTLLRAFEEAKEGFNRAKEERDPETMYRALRSMVPEIHRFFDEVMVMVEDEKVRNNRLALLRNIMILTREFAAFDRIVFPSA